MKTTSEANLGARLLVCLSRDLGSTLDATGSRRWPYSEERGQARLTVQVAINSMVCGFGRANVGNQIDCVQVKLYLELQILLHPLSKSQQPVSTSDDGSTTL